MVTFICDSKAMTITQMKKRKIPLQNRSKERVEHILGATRQLVINQNEVDITTSLIARTANIPIGSVYQYFKDREDIFLTLAEHVLQEQDKKLQKIFDVVSTHAHWRHVVKVILQAYAQVAMEDELYRKLNALLVTNRAWKQISQASTNRMITFFSGYGLLAQHGLSEAEARNTVRVIVIMVVAVVHRALELPSEEDARLLLDEMPKMVTAYLATILGD